MQVANVQSPLLPQPVSPRLMLPTPNRSALIPGAKKVVSNERQSRTPCNFYFSEALAKRCSSIHPGTKVLFGNASRLKEVPSRKPVPERRTPNPSSPSEHTESLWSDEGDDASTVLGENGRPQRRPAADQFRSLPPGRTIISWLGGGGSKGLNSAKSGGNGDQGSSSAKTRSGPADFET